MVTRVAVIEKWVAVADICRCLHNYNAVLEITSSLNRSSVFRLKKTWLKVSKQVLIILYTNILYAVCSQSAQSLKNVSVVTFFSRQKHWLTSCKSWCHQRGGSKIWERLWRSEFGAGTPLNLISHVNTYCNWIMSCCFCPSHQLWSPLCALSGDVPHWPGFHWGGNTKLHWRQLG